MNQQLIEKILDYAVCHGADFAEVFYEDVRRSNLTVLDQKVPRRAPRRAWASACSEGRKAHTSTPRI